MTKSEMINGLIGWCSVMIAATFAGWAIGYVGTNWF